MTIADIKKGADQRMQKSIEKLRIDLAKIRTGRVHTGMLDHINVDYYGSATPISQVASISLLDSRTLSVQPWEKKLVAVIDKAIRDSDLGLNPSNMGDIIRVPMPPLTEDRRRELTKVIKGEIEDAKVAVRNLRREANEQVKKLLKDKAISEDDERRAEDEVQKLTDRYVAEIDRIFAEKEREIMTV